MPSDDLKVKDIPQTEAEIEAAREAGAADQLYATLKLREVSAQMAKGLARRVGQEHGKAGGRPPGDHEDVLQEARDMRRKNSALTVAEIARRLIDRGSTDLSERQLRRLITKDL